MAKFRKKLGKKYSKKMFSKTAKKVRRKNYQNTTMMRGGYRL
mgnify:CR=1 FL=1